MTGNSWHSGVKSNRRVGVRPTGVLAGALLVAAALLALAVAGWGVTELSPLWSAAAILSLAGVLVLTLRGFPLFAILTTVAGAVVWGAATRGMLPDGWMDILGLLKFIGVNLGFDVPLIGAFLAALMLDARRLSRAAIDEAVSGRRWWGKPDDHLPRLKELEALPSARFFALGEGGCTHLVVAGRRVALFLPTVWPHGEFSMDASGQVLRGGRLFVPGSEDVDGLAAEVHTWREQLAQVGGAVRGYLVVAPSRGDVSEDLVISVAPGEHLHLVHAHEMVEAAGRWLAAEPYRVELSVMERLLVIASGNKLPEPSPLARSFARTGAFPTVDARPTVADAAFAAAVGTDGPSGAEPGSLRDRLTRGRFGRNTGGDRADGALPGSPSPLEDDISTGPRGGDFDDDGAVRDRFGRTHRDPDPIVPANDSWESRATRELVGSWDSESANKLAAWAADSDPRGSFTSSSSAGSSASAGSSRDDFGSSRDDFGSSRDDFGSSRDDFGGRGDDDRDGGGSRLPWSSGRDEDSAGVEETSRRVGRRRADPEDEPAADWRSEPSADSSSASSSPSQSSSSFSSFSSASAGERPSASRPSSPPPQWPAPPAPPSLSGIAASGSAPEPPADRFASLMSEFDLLASDPDRFGFTVDAPEDFSAAPSREPGGFASEPGPSRGAGSSGSFGSSFDRSPGPSPERLDPASSFDRSPSSADLDTPPTRAWSSDPDSGQSDRGRFSDPDSGRSDRGWSSDSDHGRSDRGWSSDSDGGRSDRGWSSDSDGGRSDRGSGWSSDGGGSGGARSSDLDSSRSDRESTFGAGRLPDRESAFGAGRLPDRESTSDVSGAPARAWSSDPSTSSDSGRVSEPRWSSGSGSGGSDRGSVFGAGRESVSDSGWSSGSSDSGRVSDSGWSSDSGGGRPDRGAAWSSGADGGRPDRESGFGAGRQPDRERSSELGGAPDRDRAGRAPADGGRFGTGERPARRPAERPAWTGSLFDGEKPELVAEPLELRRSWDADPAARSMRRRDRQQPGQGGHSSSDNPVSGVPTSGIPTSGSPTSGGPRSGGPGFADSSATGSWAATSSADPHRGEPSSADPYSAGSWSDEPAAGASARSSSAGSSFNGPSAAWPVSAAPTSDGPTPPSSASRAEPFGADQAPAAGRSRFAAGPAARPEISWDSPVDPARSAPPPADTSRTTPPLSRPSWSDAPRLDAPRLETPRSETPRSETPRLETPRSDSTWSSAASGAARSDQARTEPSVDASPTEPWSVPGRSDRMRTEQTRPQQARPEQGRAEQAGVGDSWSERSRPEAARGQGAQAWGDERRDEPAAAQHGNWGPAPADDGPAWWDAEAPQAARGRVEEEPAEPPAATGKRSLWGRSKSGKGRKGQAAEAAPSANGGAGAASPAAGEDWASEAAGRGQGSGRPAWATDPTSGYESDPSGEFTSESRARATARPVAGGGEQERGGSAVPGQRQRARDMLFDDDVAPLELNLDEEPKNPEQRSRRFLRRK